METEREPAFTAELLRDILQPVPILSPVDHEAIDKLARRLTAQAPPVEAQTDWRAALEQNRAQNCEIERRLSRFTRPYTNRFRTN